MVKLLPIKKLNLGFNDAENYKRFENRELFNQIFTKTSEYEKLLNNSTYFLIGEKGTGKTAYAVYLTNNKIDNTVGTINYVRETEYQKFISLKNDNHLQLSDYVNIWKVIIYLLISEKINAVEKKNNIFYQSSKFRALQNAVDEYYVNAFSPEIIYAMNFVEKTKFSAQLISKHINAGGEEQNDKAFTHSKFQTNLLYIQKHFEEALSSLNLKENYILFIDGIDIRPHNIPYSDYLECVKGLTNAVWAVNNDFFANIQKSKGRLRVVLLLRPDIFAVSGLQNPNNKIRDNSVLLNWLTTYKEYKNSELFSVADNLLNSQQENQLPYGMAWNYYFPYNISSGQFNNESFVGFLRYSLYRPRDIITMMKIMQEVFISDHYRKFDHFHTRDFESSEFKKKYSDYLLGEIKDHLSFYFIESDYELFLKFFTYLNGKYRFKYNDFLKFYNEFHDYATTNNINLPSFFETADIFLQFLYDLNVICFIEMTHGEMFFRWCFRQRDYSNISPKVKSGLTYEIHYGLQKGLNAGKEIRG